MFHVNESRRFGRVDRIEVDILEVDVMGVDVMGVDVFGSRH